MVKTLSKPNTRSPTDIDLILGKNLRILRLAQRVSQDKLAEHLDITFQQIQKYERGENRIAASRIYEMAEILEVSILDFFKGVPAHSQRFSGKLYSEENVRIFQVINTLKTPEKKETALRLIKAL